MSKMAQLHADMQQENDKQARIEALGAALREWHMAEAVLNDRIGQLEMALRSIRMQDSV